MNVPGLTHERFLLASIVTNATPAPAGGGGAQVTMVDASLMAPELSQMRRSTVMAEVE